MSLTHTLTHSPTQTADIEQRCRALGLSLAAVARMAGVSVRRIYENRVGPAEIALVLAVLDEHKWLTGPEILTRDKDLSLIHI